MTSSSRFQNEPSSLRSPQLRWTKSPYLQSTTEISARRGRREKKLHLRREQRIENRSSSISGEIERERGELPTSHLRRSLIVEKTEVISMQMDIEVRSWSSLPEEILSLIVSHLLGADFATFYAVCKWWSKTPPPIARPNHDMILPCCPSLASPPFLLLPSNKLFHPIYKYLDFTQVVYDSPGPYIRASNCGWILMTLYEKRVFFFNPLTNEKVELPDMKFTYYWPKLAFSSPPTTSPAAAAAADCLVFGVQQDPWRVINIFTLNIKHGQQQTQPDWTHETIDCTRDFELSSCNPIFFNGEYYCLGKCGSLLLYNPESNTHRWVGPPPNPPNRSILGCQYYMVESQGKLLLVFTDREGHSVNVARLDATKRAVWYKVDNLEDTMLFVSQVASFSAKSVVRGTGNKIYFSRLGDDNKILFYSLAKRKYYCLDGGRSWNNFHSTKTYPNSTWIKPCHSI